MPHLLFTSMLLAAALGAEPGGIGVNGEAPPAVDPDQNFLRLDLDGDGRLSAEEARRDATLLQQFKSLDTNHDGALTPDEYASFSTG